jgi:hypothetical protein
MRPRLAFGIVGACSAALACQLIAGIGDRTVWDGGADGNVDPCTNDPNIPPNAGDTDGAANSDDILAALHTLDLGLDASPPLGFNLDQRCTCPGTASCTQRDGGVTCDGEGGIDNAGRDMFTTFSAFITQDSMNQSIDQGVFGAFIRITDFNGGPDDSQVRVAVYSSLGFDGAGTPAWDGGDHWIVDNASLNGSGDAGDFNLAANTATVAYVANDTLVAHVKIPIVVGSTQYPVTINFDSGLIVAKLVMSPDRKSLVSMTGTLAGRWDTTKLLTSLQTLPDPFGDGGSHLCKGTAVFQGIQTTVCDGVDIVADNTADNQGVPCNAVSLALGFTAVPAQFGSQQTAPPIGTPCGSGYAASCP